jgi:hypothetical protein
VTDDCHDASDDVLEIDDAAADAAAGAAECGDTDSTGGNISANNAAVLVPPPGS